ncbi:MAG: IstB domain protein ATP-binding protein [Dehalococcoidales bacterium]|nr:IstB domain protein ATP-binding protein [Dehalococcoidales bacterium]
MDDFLFTLLSECESRDLLEVVEGRYDAGSTGIASQCPIPDWHPAIVDPTLADIICDRLLPNAYRIKLKGDSVRHKHGESKRTSDSSTVKAGVLTLKTQTIIS